MIYTITLNPAVDREMTVSEFDFNTVLRAVDWRMDAGGKGFNVSRMLASLGVQSTALAFAGGHNGEVLKGELETLGVTTDFVQVCGETRTNISIVTTRNDRYLKVNEPGPTIELTEQQALIERVVHLVESGDWWVLSGSLPPGVTPDIYATLTTLIQEHGAHAILDTSGEALRQACQARPYLMKPNAEELHALTGMPVETRDQVKAAMAETHALGPCRVVVSMGKEGAMFCDDGRTWLAHGPAIKEKNPIGAGDSMIAGLVWGLSQGFTFSDAMRWAIACGAATASLPGTRIGPRSLVESLLSQVRLTSV